MKESWFVISLQKYDFNYTYFLIICLISLYLIMWKYNFIIKIINLEQFKHTIKFSQIKITTVKNSLFISDHQFCYTFKWSKFISNDNFSSYLGKPFMTMGFDVLKVTSGLPKS